MWERFGDVLEGFWTGLLTFLYWRDNTQRKSTPCPPKTQFRKFRKLSAFLTSSVSVESTPCLWAFSKNLTKDLERSRCLRAFISIQHHGPIQTRVIQTTPREDGPVCVCIGTICIDLNGALNVYPVRERSS